jgi:hypothetical protein
VEGAEFDPAGARLLTRSWDGTFRLWEARTGLPMTEPFFTGGKRRAVAPSPDWTLFAVCNSSPDITIWEEPSLPSPAPDWLPELAEAVAGKRLDANSAEVEVPATALPALQARLASLPATNAWNRWARGYMTDPVLRPLTP